MDNRLHFVRRPERSHITIYIYGDNNSAKYSRPSPPGCERQDFRINSEAQRQHEERRRWAAAERTKCLSDILLSWRLYEFPGILWRDFQTLEVGDFLWNMWADRTWIVKVRIKGRTCCCSCRTERCQFSFLCCGKQLKLNAALTGLRPVVVSVHVFGFPRFRVRPVGAFN